MSVRPFALKVKHLFVEHLFAISPNYEHPFAMVDIKRFYSKFRNLTPDYTSEKSL